LTGIRNSAHNFAGNAWSNHEICKPCHIPHRAMTAAGRLWNHTLSSATYTTFDGTAGVAGATAMDRASILCMSCHDGTVALDSFGGATTGSTFAAGAALVGTDLTNDHPIGNEAVYPTTTSTRFNPQTISSPGTTSERHTVPNPSNTAQSVSLYKMTVNSADAWTVGCRSCHNPHRGREVADKMLAFSNDASALCLTCHIK
jgi:predicted CXXCH cytochrome family protein